ncbi:MAG: M56 family metallopeptidase [Lachnospiraceae bacterium]|nr:M56 family metallopeptidase [Lachnospiraceae bacterium]
MENIFIKLFNIALSASLIVIFIFIARLILKKAPKWTHCLLWIIVGLRLVCPFNLVSPIGLLPDRDFIRIDRVSNVDSAVYDNTSSAGSPADLQNTSEGESKYTYLPQINTGIAAIDSPINDSIQRNIQTDSAPVQIYSLVFTLIWAPGVIGMLIYAIISYAVIKRRVRESIPCESDDKAKKVPNVFLTDAIATPFILGIFRPGIYLPASISKDNAELVIAHERAHLLRHDHWWKPLGFLLLSVYWFNPIIWLAYIVFCRDIEMACDEKVISTIGEKYEIKYSETLLALSMPRKRISACPVAFGETGVKNRVKNVLNYKRPAFWLVTVSVAAVIAIGILLLTNRSSEIEDTETHSLLENASVEHSALSVEFTPNQSYQREDTELSAKQEDLLFLNSPCDNSDPAENTRIWNLFSDKVNAGKPAKIKLVYPNEIFPNMSSDPLQCEIYYELSFDGEQYSCTSDYSNYKGDYIPENTSISMPYLISEIQQFDNKDNQVYIYLMLTDRPDMTKLMHQSVLKYKGYEEADKQVPFFFTFTANKDLRIIINDSSEEPSEEPDFSDITPSESDMLTGRYISSRCLYMSPLSSSSSECGQEIYSFTDEAYSIYTLDSPYSDPVRIEKRISEDWEDYNPQVWAGEALALSRFSYEEIFADESFKMIKYENGMEIYRSSDRLLLARPRWSIFELKRIDG